MQQHNKTCSSTSPFHPSSTHLEQAHYQSTTLSQTSYSLILQGRIFLRLLVPFPFDRLAHATIMTQTSAQPTDIPKRPKGSLPTRLDAEQLADDTDRDTQDSITYLSS